MGTVSIFAILIDLPPICWLSDAMFMVSELAVDNIDTRGFCVLVADWLFTELKGAEARFGFHRQLAC